MCTCELLVATMMNILIMFKSTRSTKTLLDIETVRLEVYPAEEPMLKAPAAPQSMQDDVRGAVPRTSTGKSTRRSEEEEDDIGSHKEEASSHGDTPQKLDRPHTQEGVADVDGGSRGLLSQLSVCAEDWDGETREQLNRRMMVLDVLSLLHG